VGFLDLDYMREDSAHDLDRLTYRHLGSELIRKRKKIGQSEELAAFNPPPAPCWLNACEVSSLYGCVISDGHLLLLVQLTSIDVFFQATSTKEAVDRDVSSLTKAIGAIHRLEVVRRVCETSISGQRIEGSSALQLGSKEDRDIINLEALIPLIERTEYDHLQHRA
jgi:hypothetical protein